MAGTRREALRTRCSRPHDIEARPAWKPLHLQPLFADHERVGGAVAERIFDQGLCLPSGSSLPDADQDRVIELVRLGDLSKVSVQVVRAGVAAAVGHVAELVLEAHAARPSCARTSACRR